MKDYAYVAFLPPSVLMDLAKPPEGHTVRTVFWSDDRQAFAFVIEAPDSEEFEREMGIEALPIVPISYVVTEAQGGRFVRLELPVENADDDA